MKLLTSLSFVASITLAGIVSGHAPAIAAEAVSAPVVAVSAASQMAPEAYYYYRNRRYPYRYHGMYFNHRYYRSNRWHYY